TNPDLRYNRHPGPEYMLPGFSGIERDLYRNSLHNLDVISRRVFRWKQTHDRAACPGNTLHESFISFPVGVHMDVARLAHPHVFKLGLFVVGGDPYVVQVDDAHEFLSGEDILT